MAAHLPPSILGLIFEYVADWNDITLADDERGRCAAKDRCLNLWTCSLVCRSWRPWAQETLHTQIVIYQQTSLIWLIETLESRPDLASAVRDLWMLPFSSRNFDRQHLKKLLAYLPNLRCYRVFAPVGIGVMDDVQQQECLPTSTNARLTHLCVNNFYLQKESFQCLPPSLERLDLQGGSLSDLGPRNYPKLNVLCIDTIRSQVFHNTDTFRSPRLKRLLLEDNYALIVFPRPIGLAHDPTLRDQLEVIEFGHRSSNFPVNIGERYIAESYMDGAIPHCIKVIVNGDIVAEFDKQGCRIRAEGKM